jgi:hypothetical protein
MMFRRMAEEMVVIRLRESDACVLNRSCLWIQKLSRGHTDAAIRMNRSRKLIERLRLQNKI